MKDETRYRHPDLITQDRERHDRWLRSSGAIASLFLAMLIAILLLNGPFPQQSRAGLKAAAESTEFSSSSTESEQNDVLWSHKLMKTVDPDKLPVQKVDQPF